MPKDVIVVVNLDAKPNPSEPMTQPALRMTSAPISQS